MFVDNLRLTIVYATPNILEVLKTQIELRLKEEESPNSISVIYQSMLPDQANQRPKIDLLSTRQNEDTIDAIKGACRTKNDDTFKSGKALGCNDFGGQMIQSFFPQLAKKIPVTRKFLQFSHNGLAPEDSNRRFSQI